jgi:hypothetical protein
MTTLATEMFGLDSGDALGAQLFEKSGWPEIAQQMAAHESARTTSLYDGGRDEV